MATSLLGLSQRSPEVICFGGHSNMAPSPLRLLHGDRQDGPVLAEPERGGEKTRDAIDSPAQLSPDWRDAAPSISPRRPSECDRVGSFGGLSRSTRGSGCSVQGA